ncbi:MAG: sugar phosphate nucleotidyltransferase [Gemmatimonadota bacterium]
MLDTVVIPCGGLGRRLQPITRWVPKELLPVGLKPLLYWALDEVADAGFMRAIIVTNPHKPMVEAAARQYQGPIDLEFLPQEQPRGLGDALARARDELAGSPFAVVFPDHIVAGRNAIQQVVDAHRATRRAAVLLAQVAPDDLVPHGSAGRAITSAGPDGTLQVTDIAEKGSARFEAAGEPVALRPVGRMVLPADVFKDVDDIARHLAPWAPFDNVPLLQRLAWRGDLVGTITSGRFFDVAEPEGFRQAVVAFPSRV